MMNGGWAWLALAATGSLMMAVQGSGQRPPATGPAGLEARLGPAPIEWTGEHRRTDAVRLGCGGWLMQYSNPDRQDKPSDRPVASRIRAHLPPEGIAVRAIVFDLGYTYTPDRSDLQAIAREEGWAMVGCLLRYKYGTELFLRAMEDFAERSGRPELLRCPIVLFGFSRNGARAWDFYEENPDRTLAIALGGNPGIAVKWGRQAENAGRVALARSIPTLTLVGSKDPFVDYDKGEAKFWHNAVYPQIRRQEGVTWGMMIGWGYGHGWEGSWTPFTVFVQEALRLRAGGEATGGKESAAGGFRPIRFEDGWLGEYGWKHDWPEIGPVAGFGGDKSTAVWLVSGDMAHVWRAYQVREPRVTLSVRADGDEVVLRAEVPAGVEQVEFFDRSQSLGVVKAAPFELRSGGLKRGTRTVFAVAKLADGPTPSRPVTLAGGKVLDWRAGDADQKRAEQPISVIRLDPPLRAAMRALLAAGGDAARANVSAEQVRALRSALEALSSDAFVEQRTAAAALLGSLGAAGGERPGELGE